MKLNRDKRELTQRSQAMYARKRSGASIKEVAAEFGLSTARAQLILEREADRQEFELMRVQMGFA